MPSVPSEKLIKYPYTDARHRLEINEALQHVLGELENCWGACGLEIDLKAAQALLESHTDEQVRIFIDSVIELFSKVIVSDHHIDLRGYQLLHPNQGQKVGQRATGRPIIDGSAPGDHMQRDKKRQKSRRHMQKLNDCCWGLGLFVSQPTAAFYLWNGSHVLKGPVVTAKEELADRFEVQKTLTGRIDTTKMRQMSATKRFIFSILVLEQTSSGAWLYAF